MLGTGPRADVVGHLFGLVSGGGLGSFAARVHRCRPGPAAQWAFAAWALAAVILCWRLALADQPTVGGARPEYQYLGRRPGAAIQIDAVA
jgi:hypothetical protein